MRAELVVDVGGDLTFDPPEGGLATAATVALFERDGTVVQAAASATLDTCDTTLSANAAVGALTMTLTSVTGVTPGRTYRVDNADSQHERLVVVGVNTSTLVVTFREPLQYAYVSTDTFVGERLTYSVSAALVDTRARGYEARWAYTIGGVSYNAIRFYDVVRQKWPTVILTTDAFKRHVSSDLASDVMQLVSRKGDSFAEEIAVATEKMRWDLKRRGAEVDLFRSYSAFVPVVAEAVLLKWAERAFTPNSWQGDAEGWYQHQLALYEQALDLAVDVTDSYDADDSGDTTDTEAAARPAPAARFYL